MKTVKTLLLILTLAIFLPLSGCTGSTIPNEKRENFRILNLTMNYQNQALYSGYLQEIILLENDITIEKITKEFHQRKISDELVYKLDLKHEFLNQLTEDERTSVVETTEYYTQNNRYYFEDGVWNIETKDFQSDGLVKITFIEDHFLSSLNFKKVGTLVTFTGTIRQDSISAFFDQTIASDIKNVQMEINYDSAICQLFYFNFTYQTTTDRIVKVNTTILYNEHDFVLPIV